MDFTHVHLYLNHFSVIGTFFCLLLIAYAKWLPSLKPSTQINAQINTQLENLIFYFVLLLGLITIPVFLTGEPAEEALEYLPNIESFIEPHETIGKFAFAFSLANALLAAALLFLSKQTAPYRVLLKKLVVGLVLICAVLFSITGYRGGQIRHTEIRGGTPEASNN